MSAGVIVAVDYASGRQVCLRWRDGRVVELSESRHLEETEWTLAPGLLDVQVNGFAGVDFQMDGLHTHDLLKATDALCRVGCTRFLPTLITDEWRTLLSRLRHLRRLREGNRTLRRSIVGWHIEGPFLSPVAGFHGAHDPEVMIDPTPEHMRELRAAAGNIPLLLTLAAERQGAIGAIRAGVDQGMTISLGHTNVSASRLAEAIKAGASGFTHLGNALPQTLDRHDNLIWRVLDTSGLTVSVIVDGHHVSPPLFRLIHRLLPRDALFYTTDAMAAAAAPPGRYTLGRLELEVGDDRVAREPGKSNFAGSALTPLEGVFRAAGMLDESWSLSWERFSEVPARWLGLPPALAPGNPADFCLLRLTPEGQLHSLRVFIGGQELD